MNTAPRSEAPRALITGLRGFTGAYLARELTQSGYRVFGTAHAGERVGQDVFEADLCDRARLGEVIRDVQPNVVAHLAGIAFVGHGDANAIYNVNLLGTRNLLSELAESPVVPSAVLLASSAQVYGTTAVEPIDESVPTVPQNDYAVSKLAMEQMARLWFDRLPIVIARPFNYTGFGQSVEFLLPKIVSHFAAGLREIELGNLDVERDFSDVRMVAAAYRRLIELAPAGEVFNICSGTAASLSDVLEIVSRRAGYEIGVRVNPAFVRANDVKRQVGSCRKLIDAIGGLPDISLAETLTWMYEADLAAR
ncbi:MAG: GDP-mannose 4,6-dehydratase [Sterolibacteriaceae bacterium]|nr:GDP-mannose 4,6-dehydratase [Sterolibacteriaceae bacterium]MBK9085300.1 GDP-mannose 4,6-dehydratase [Sterolibacteriaceae bacterium]